jgi:hypothetical protein
MSLGNGDERQRIVGPLSHDGESFWLPPSIVFSSFNVRENVANPYPIWLATLLAFKTRS